MGVGDDPVMLAVVVEDGLCLFDAGLCLKHALVGGIQVVEGVAMFALRHFHAVVQLLIFAPSNAEEVAEDSARLVRPAILIECVGGLANLVARLEDVRLARLVFVPGGDVVGSGLEGRRGPASAPRCSGVPGSGILLIDSDSMAASASISLRNFRNSGPSCSPGV